MDAVDLVVGYLTGLHLLAPHRLPLPTLLMTGLVVNVCNAVMCRLLARNNGHAVRRWTGLGMIFGLWAVAVLIVLPKRVPAAAAPEPH